MIYFPVRGIVALDGRIRFISESRRSFGRSGSRAWRGEEARRVGTAAHPLPTLRLGAPQRRPLALPMRQRMEHIRYRRGLPRLPAPVGWDAVPLLQPMVAAFGLVFALMLLEVE